MQYMQRILSPYEQTQLTRHGKAKNLDPAALGSQPIEYVTGKAEFCGLVFSVSPAVLIPRVETEELVALTLQVVGEKIAQTSVTSPLLIAEVGTGSGAISISIAKHLFPFREKVKIVAGDISSEALAVAKTNSQLLESQDPEITWVESNLLEHFPVEQPFHIIVANLPYIPSSRIETLDESVRLHEPHLALDGGPRGLDLIYTLLEQAVKRLTPDGVVLLEVDDTHELGDFARFSNWYTFELRTDSFGKNRFVIAHRKVTSTLA